MGGRGATSATASTTSLSPGNFSGSGSKEIDKLVNDALKANKDLEIKNKLQENMAKRFLASGKTPMQELKDRIKKSQEYHDKDLKESKNFKKDYAERERYAKQQSDLATKYANEDKKIKATDVRGNSYEKMSVRADRQTHKAVQLNKGLTTAISEQRNRERRIKEYKSTIKEKVNQETRKAALAEAYLKKKKR